MENVSYKSGFVAIVGNPSVGKSTLINALVGEKIAITSFKPQTTRNKIQGIVTTDEYQMVFIDTPGMNTRKTKLERLMDRTIGEALNGTDVVVAVVDISKMANSALLLQNLERVKCPVILVLNKMDLIKNKEELLEIMKEYSKIYNFDEIIPISAIKKKGVEDIKKAVLKRLPYGPKYYPEDIITDSPEKIMIAEIVREKALDLLSDEVPHGIAVEVETMKKRVNKEIIDISVNIYCERDAHKPIIIGRGGKMLKEIGRRAREDMERFLESKVFLEIWVKVKSGWKDDDKELKRLHFME